MYYNEISIPNETDGDISIWIEPWTFDVEIPSGKTATLKGDSDVEGAFEMETNNGCLELYAWEGSNLVVDIDGVEIINTKQLRIPKLPSGLSSKQFVDLLFKNKDKKWWEFWK